jgi:acetyl esterase/lipase
MRDLVHSSGPIRGVGTPPPFDPELAKALEVINQGITPGSLTLDLIFELRMGIPDFVPPTEEDLQRKGEFRISHHSAPGMNGAPDVPLLVCLPNTGSSEPVPLLYYIHGGGMVLGDCLAGLPEFLGLVQGMGVGVMSVEYRLAPETPHPGPVEDCYAGLLWAATHGEELGIDSKRVVVAGVSAGGGLAAGTALMARDLGTPQLAGQMLICPMLDDRNNTPSALQMAGLGLWDKSDNEVGWSALLGELAGGPNVPPYAAPARARDLSGLPPTFIDVGSAETFRDEDIAYANGIWLGGGQAELHVWAGGFHAFDGAVPDAPVSRQARTARRNWLDRLLS